MESRVKDAYGLKHLSDMNGEINETHQALNLED